MLSLIVHALRVAHSVIREHAKKVTRSSKWNGVRKTALKANPKCACCGDTAHLQVHHMQPFHIKPELELDPKNLIVLCMGKNECHLLIGHGDNFKKYNPYIAADALNVSCGSITGAQAIANAKKNAIFLPVEQ
jgi:5-methylcytosine-specific restriction protein A